MVGYWQSLSRSLFFRFLDYPWKKCRNRLTLYLKRTLIITTNLPIKYDTPAKALGSGALRKFLECIVKRNVGTNNTNNIVTRSITGGVTARPFTTAQSSQPSVHRTSQNFDEMIKRRHLQAKKSVLVEVNSRYVFHDLCEYCQQFGHVKYAIHYRIKNEKEVFIFEFENSEVVKNLLTQCSHPEDDEIVPVHSHLLLYGSEALNHDSSCQSLFESVNPPTQAEILRDLLEARNISEQMIKLHLSEQLSDLGSRLRFLICSQLEEALSGMFPNCQVLPFGSSVNGFGKNFCDLDMLLSLNTVQNNPTSRLKFQTKKAYANDRMQTQRTLETVGDILQNFLPGIVQVQRILQARVPILKFHHIPTGIYCDLSISNKNGVLMSKLLYMCSELDPHIQPLMYTIRKWARENHLTHDVPGRWISNFSLSLMVLFFLQARSQPLLLPLMDLVCIAGKSDKTLPDDMEYISQKGLKHPPSEKTEDLEILLKEFFLFYEKFNFKERGLSLTTGHSMVKPDYSPLYIENPLEQELNVSKNVSSEEMERFSTCVRTALWKLELNNIKNSDDLWGILKLFDPKAAENQSNPQTVKGFQVSALFNSKNGVNDSSTLTNKDGLNSFLYRNSKPRTVTRGFTLKLFGNKKKKIRTKEIMNKIHKN